MHLLALASLLVFLYMSLLPPSSQLAAARQNPTFNFQSPFPEREVTPTVVPPDEASARVHPWVNQSLLHPERSGLSLLEAALLDAEAAALMGRDTLSAS